MAKAHQPLALLAKRLNLTDPEPEEYILSKEEEDERINNEIDSKKKYMSWKLEQLQFSKQEILKKISEVDWQKEIDREEILQQSNSIKHQNIWHEEQRRKEKEADENKKKELIERCDATYMFKLMKWSSQNNFGRKLIVNENTTYLIKVLCYFLSNDIRFEKELGFSFSKGLLIRGISGLGKTHLVRCLENNELNPVLVLSMIEITDEIKDQGQYELKLENKKVVYLDDVGTEEATVNHYGTKISFFKNFIELVYLKNKEKGFNKLMISTNNSFAEIEAKYGFRVRSRMKDMFNTIDVKGEDLRG